MIKKLALPVVALVTMLILTSAPAKAAVRFGITVAGVELAYESRPAGAQGAGDVPRALGPGRTLPEGGGSYSLAFSEPVDAKRKEQIR